MVKVEVLFQIYSVLLSVSNTEDLLKSLRGKTLEDKFKVPGAKEFLNQSLPCLIDLTLMYQNESVLFISNKLWNNCFLPSAGAFDCTVDDKEAFIKLTLVSIAVIALLFMTSCKTRKSYKIACCWGRPSPVVPLNMLDSYENRHGYMFAFGVTVNTCFDVLFGNYDRVLGAEIAKDMNLLPPYFSVFIKISLALFICIIAYPFFIAQNMKNKLVGSLIGFFYSFLYLVLLVDKQVTGNQKCWPIFRRIDQKKRIPIMVLNDLPRFACLVALVLLFGSTFIIYLRKKYYSHLKRRSLPLKQEIEDWKKSYMYIHIKEVFQKHVKELKQEQLENLVEIQNISIKKKVMDLIKSKLYERKPGFKYSTKLMISKFIGILSVYLVFIQLAQLGYVLFIKTWEQILDENKKLWIAKNLDVPVALVKKHVTGLQTCWWLALATSTTIYFLVLLNSMVWYRRHVLMLRKGDRSFLPSSIKKQTLDSQSLMTASFKFAGFQVGYSAWGYLIIHVVLWLVSSFLSMFLFVPMFYGGPSFVLTAVKDYWPSVIVGIATFILQGQVASRCFLISNDNVSVDNRRAFHVMSYILFYFNVFIGVISCLFRIAYGGILGVVMLPRLQKSTMPRSYERRDPGYLAYLGFLMVEHQHSNPALQCFVRILLQQINKRLTTDEFSDRRRRTQIALKVFDRMKSIPETDKSDQQEQQQLQNTGETSINSHPYRTQAAISRSARIRWFLAIMLIQNPSLRRYRGHFLRSRLKKKHVAKALFSHFRNKRNVFNGDSSDVENMVDNGEKKSSRKHDKIKKKHRRRKRDDEEWIEGNRTHGKNTRSSSSSSDSTSSSSSDEDGDNGIMGKRFSEFKKESRDLMKVTKSLPGKMAERIKKVKVKKPFRRSSNNRTDDSTKSSLNNMDHPMDEFHRLDERRESNNDKREGGDNEVRDTNSFHGNKISNEVAVVIDDGN